MVTLKLMTGSEMAGLPAAGTDACFSIHTTTERWQTRLPIDEPWTHQPERPPTPLAPIEQESENMILRGA